MQDRDTKGDLYEYMLSKLSTAGTNGQFRTPRHIIKMMVALLAPGPREMICDPACGTGGFLVAAAEYVRELKDGEGGRLLPDRSNLEHSNNQMFHVKEKGTDFVWFYDMAADEYSLDDKRQPIADNDSRILCSAGARKTRRRIRTAG